MSHVLVRRSRVEAPVEDLFAWYERPAALERLSPPWGTMKVLEREGGVTDGARTVLRIKAGPIPRRWVSVHRGYVPGRRFVDYQAQGPFRSWEHTHRFEPLGGGASLLEDRIEYVLPLGIAGDLVARRAIARSVERLFAYRHRVTRNDLATHRRYASAPLRIAITGASGLIGSQLLAFLSTGGHDVVPIVRGHARRGIRWDPAAGAIDAAALEGFDAVVHLAGETIGGRLTRAKKHRIMRSRRDGTRLLATALAGLSNPPPVLVSASAIGFYGDRGDEVLDESSGSGEGFLAEVVREWEAAAEPARAAGIRVVHPRFGIVLSPAGGALAPLLLPFKAGAGGPIGGGRQWWSWVGIDDVLGAILHAIATEALDGVVNVSAPNPVRQREFARTLARVLRRPGFLPLPAAIARAVLGEVAGEMVLPSQRVDGRRLRETGFEFGFPDLETALRHVLGRTLDADRS